MCKVLKFEVNEAVWLAAAIMTLETYEANPNFTVEDIVFKQSDIQKRAQFYTEKTVNHARVNQWYNADNPNHSYNYLREIKDKRRITYISEFNGEKELPTTIDRYEPIYFEKDPERYIVFGDLVRFIEREYYQIFLIQFDKIIDHLNRYANQQYIDPKKVVGEKKKHYLTIRSSGSRAVTELNKLADYFAEKYGVYNRNKSKWLTGGNDVVRGYLWNQLKYENKLHIPTSISLFADKRKDEENIRFRIAVELDEKAASEKDYMQHHYILKREFIQNENYCYHVKYKNGDDSYRTDLSLVEIKEKVESGEILKVQLVYELYSDQIEAENLTNETLLDKFDEAFSYLKQYYDLVINDEQIEQEEIPTHTPSSIKYQHEKNQILYGPPGTGKTFHATFYAVAIIENRSIQSVMTESYEEVTKRYKQYKEAGQIMFTTFHQSYGYEEFIEGIKPVLDEERSENVEYKIEAGAFKAFCEQAQKLDVSTVENNLNGDQKIWKVSIGGSGENWLKEECFKKGSIRIGWASEGLDFEEYSNDSLYNFYEEMSIGDIVFSLGDQKHIDAIGIISGEPEWLEGEEYPRSREIKWIVTNIRERIFEMNGHKNLALQTIYKLHRISLANANDIILKYAKNDGATIKKNNKKYVFIIDEINRGNISKILGELITLIEPTKRLGAVEEMKVQLPYSREEFGVPENVYILGTMNTADRSIAMMDTALRRRFRFIEMMPNIQLLNKIKVGNIDIHKMVDTINKRIEVLYDREHTIGHAYFMGLVNEPTIENLENIFKNAIIPLLQEYFYEDYSKIQLILGDNAKTDDYKFILDTAIQMNTVFKANPDIDIPEQKYSIQLAAFNKQASYIEIYE